MSLRFFFYVCISNGLNIMIANIKRNYIPILLATALALLALLLSQALWLRYASNKDIQEKNALFQSCFDESISALVNEFMERNTADLPYKIALLVEEKEKEKAVDGGYSTGENDVRAMFENALIALSVRERFFHLSRLDTLLTAHLNEKGSVESAHIALQDTKEDKMLDEVRQEYIPANGSFFAKTYTADRKIEMPPNSLLIKAEYRIQQPGYLKSLGVVAVTSFAASMVIISLLFYLLFILRRRYIEVSNMEKSFHGAIHDLKSPLAFVYFTLSVLEENEMDMHKKTKISLIEDKVKYLADKIMRLLIAEQDLKKIPEDTKQSVFLSDVLEKIESEVKTMFTEKTIEFKNEIASDLYLWGVPDLLEAAMRILIENAVKYNHHSPSVKINATRGNECIIIEVVDNGIGISKKELKELFKPYYTSDAKHGTGIGLYYAKRIIQAHGGEISVESILGKGSSFTVKFPKNKD